MWANDAIRKLPVAFPGNFRVQSGTMENELKLHMRACADIFAAAASVQIATVAERAAGDWRFFDRIEHDKTFTARKYDQVMSWFSANWPEGADWPSDVPRPVAEPAEAAT